jgi:hypothetical protein
MPLHRRLLAISDAVEYWSNLDATRATEAPAFTEIGFYTVYFEVNRGGATAAGSATVVIRPQELAAIRATPYSGAYDGQPHKIGIDGLENGDIVCIYCG